MANAKITKIRPKFKLSDLKPKSHKLMLDVPMNPDIEMWVEIVGTESKVYALSAASILKARGGKSDKDVTLEHQLDESAELVSSLIVDWGPVEYFEMEFSTENAKTLMCDYDHKWIKQQIETIAAEKDNFFGN